jgi:hypothetical protein
MELRRLTVLTEEQISVGPAFEAYLQASRDLCEALRGEPLQKAVTALYAAWRDMPDNGLKTFTPPNKVMRKAFIEEVCRPGRT